MSVHEIKRLSLKDVPGKLRELALTYEQRPDLQTAIVIMGYADGCVCVRGYGVRTSALEATGWLHRALDAITDGAGVEDNLIPDLPGAG